MYRKAKDSKFKLRRGLPLVAALMLPLAVGPALAAETVGPLNARTTVEQALFGQGTVAQERRPRIQLAILLDTSNSMDGLIDQTRNQLWQVVNEFASARQNGVAPILEIALFEYGNDGNPAGAGYVRKLNDFTGELDAVSAGLFSLTTNGGAEYCGYAIKTAIETLQWSRSHSDIKTIFIAGNEPFTQGPVNYRDAIELANQAGISINTIHAGDHESGISEGWQQGAILAGGDYMSIDSNQKIVHIVAPQDEAIAELNNKLNSTYVPYGAQGEDKLERQLEQDSLSGGISAGLLSKRAKSKASAFYSNAQWDLVDAFDDGEVNAESLSAMEEAALPEPMQAMSADERLDYVNAKAEERKEIQRQINELSQERDAYVTEQKRLQAAAAPSVSDAMTNAVKRQAQAKNFVFEE